MKRRADYDACQDCQLHRMAKHPATYPKLNGLLDLLDLCRCECDHSADEARWSA